MSATAAAVRSQHKRRALPWPLIWTVAVAAILWWGSHAHLERTLSPRSGVGYWLGILGGSLMLLLLIYSARKRFPWLHWIGGIPTWFEIHMTLGVVGPILVLFHANFSLGATNSNVALFSMLLVSCSGVAGRYFYTRLHAHLDSHEETLEQLKAAGARLATQSTSSALLPGLLEAIERVEKRYIEPPRRPYLRLPHLLTGGIRLAIAADRRPCAAPGRRGAGLRQPPARCGATPHRIPSVCTAVLVLACAAFAAVLHAARCRIRACRRDQHLLKRADVPQCATVPDVRNALDGIVVVRAGHGPRSIGGNAVDAWKGLPRS